MTTNAPLQDSLNQCPMPINTNQNSGIDLKFLSLPINADQFFSIPLNVDQCQSIPNQAAGMINRQTELRKDVTKSIISIDALLRNAVNK